MGLGLLGNLQRPSVHFQPAGFYWFSMMMSHIVIFLALYPELGCGQLEGRMFEEKDYIYNDIQSNILKDILLIMLFQVSQFSLFASLHLVPPFPPAISSLSSCPWVMHISSLASPFPILFLILSCLFCTYHLCFLTSIPFPLFSPFPIDNPPYDLCIYDSVPVLVFCLVCFFRFSC